MYWVQTDPLLLRYSTTLGNLYSDQGRLREAKEMYQRSLAGHENILDPEHNETRLDIERLNELSQRMKDGA
jgi:hypothetical protein